jgi:hypothetical protein
LLAANEWKCTRLIRQNGFPALGTCQKSAHTHLPGHALYVQPGALVPAHVDGANLLVRIKGVPGLHDGVVPIAQAPAPFVLGSGDGQVPKRQDRAAQLAALARKEAIGEEVGAEPTISERVEEMEMGRLVPGKPPSRPSVCLTRTGALAASIPTPTARPNRPGGWPRTYRSTMRRTSHP